ncbi:hypothetical protein [Elstera cyanobacteriorum]|uniref:hypothetical protein n=1 Tax=Elstera cyanobacteriorum TaxID=2022747 RepID=UPI003C6C20F7
MPDRVLVLHAFQKKSQVQPGHRNAQANLKQRSAQFFERDVFARFPKGEDVFSPRLDPAGAPVAALRFGGKTARRTPLGVPADRRRGGNVKPRSGRSATHPIVNRRQKTRPQIQRKGLTHPC